MVNNFIDANGNKVCFSTKPHPFSSSPNHVLVIVHSPLGWVMTEHKVRGLEFPGGKREKGETIEQAAIREVWEETGAHIDELIYIGQYKVQDKCSHFVKNVYFAKVVSLETKADYMETKGAVIVEQLPETFSKEKYSFIMRDQVIILSLEQVKKLQLV
ncbi:RNA deprotection pyrophosphohydrolase [Bacillus massiliigorillae]|uniref:RNA deprotection pyrophosphohydrolase n=1 Tax=Bacillus massiliigorillae TaxID=1243664 RepID=UPI001E5EA4A7|nr:nucleoside triphosphatase YtkD [Bacillus massiliigorillae]